MTKQQQIHEGMVKSDVRYQKPSQEQREAAMKAIEEAARRFRER